MARKKRSEARKNKAAYVVFAILLVLIILCVILIFGLRSCKKNEADFTVTIDGQTVSTTLDMDEFSLTPGATAEYILSVTCKQGGRYAFTFDFDGTADAALISCVRVEIALGEEVLAGAMLSQTLGGEALVISHSFEANKAQDFTVRYTMDTNAGNETQGTRADFDILLTGQKE